MERLFFEVFSEDSLVRNLNLHIYCYAALALFENDERVDVEVCDLRVNHEEP